MTSPTNGMAKSQSWQFYNPISSAVTWLWGEQEAPPINPLCCMLRIALLPFHPPGTRLAIRGPHLKLQPPGLNQKIERRLQGDSHLDIARLSSVVKRACHSLNPFSDRRLDLIFRYTHRGLNILLTLYNEREKATGDETYTTACRAIEFLMGEINTSLSRISEASLIDQNLALSGWNQGEIQMVSDYLAEAENEQGDAETLALRMSVMDALLNLKESGRSIDGVLPRLIDEVRQQNDSDSDSGEEGEWLSSASAQDSNRSPTELFCLAMMALDQRDRV